MSADLAIRDIPLETINQSVYPNSGALQPASGISWSYHTAPQYYYRGMPYVIDPFYSTAPLPRAEWERKNNLAGASATTTVSPRTTFGANSFATSGGVFFAPTADMTAFAGGSFNSAQLLTSAMLLSSYLAKESISAAMQIKKRENLNVLVQSTVYMLHYKGRLNLPPGTTIQQFQMSVSAAIYPPAGMR
jgi:hypothetical protein